jgi:hypothetical protein
MTKPRHHDLAPAINDLNVAITLTNLLVDHADDWQAGYPTTGEGRGSKGSHSDRPLATVIAHDNHGPRADEQLTTLIVALDSELGDLIRRLTKLANTARVLAPIDPKLAFLKEEAQRIPGRGACRVTNCDTYSAGGPDRLMAGYCGKHYQQWVRLGRPDRADYERGNTDQQAS